MGAAGVGCVRCHLGGSKKLTSPSLRSGGVYRLYILSRSVPLSVFVPFFPFYLSRMYLFVSLFVCSVLLFIVLLCVCVCVFFFFLDSLHLFLVVCLLVSLCFPGVLGGGM